MVENNELYHYGIPGMKWGHRKNRLVSGSYRIEKKLRQDKKDAWKEYKSTKKQAKEQLKQAKKQYKQISRQAANKHEQARDQANKDFRQATKQRNKQIKDTYKKVTKNMSLGEKTLIYNKNAKKAIAKYMVDNKMSMKDAKAKVSKEVIRDTSIALAAVGALSIATLRKYR